VSASIAQSYFSKAVLMVWGMDTSGDNVGG